MNYVGVDIHKKYSVLCALDESGRKLREGRVEGNSARGFAQFFAGLEGPSKAVVEACWNWGLVHDELEEIEQVEEVVLAHPYKTRLIADAQIKTDRLDAHALGTLLRGNLVARAHVPRRETRGVSEGSVMGSELTIDTAATLGVMNAVMPRPLRIQYAGARYHVMSRGDRREAIFYDDADRVEFLRTLGQACLKTGWQVHAYCLMSNHFHLVLETPQPNLAARMKWLLGAYTQRFNRRHRNWGHLFGGRYKAQLIDGRRLGYLRCACDYVHLNPVRAGMVSAKRSWSPIAGAVIQPIGGRNCGRPGYE